MKRRLYSLGILGNVGLMVVAILVWAGPPVELAQKIDGAFKAKQPLPLVSQEIKGLTVDRAYEIQAGLFKLREGKGDKISGYFVGLTDPAVQKRFGIQEPIWGAIFKSMVERDGILLYRKDFRNILIETEIGFRIGKDITEPVKNLDSLKKAVVAVLPAFHFPDFAYADMKLIVVGDLIASNVGTRKVLIGETAKEDDLNAVTVKLFHNEAEITSGIGKNVGDQWGVLKWAVNDIIARGGQVKRDSIILTGVISKGIPGKPGKYVADYGPFGKIEFEYK